MDLLTGMAALICVGIKIFKLWQQENRVIVKKITMIREEE